MKKSVAFMAMCVVFTISSEILACGPKFDASYLVGGNEFGIFMMPNADFAHEIKTSGYNSSEPDFSEGLPEALQTRFEEDWRLQNTAKAGAADLYRALRDQGHAEDAALKIATEYLELRTILQDIGEFSDSYPKATDTGVPQNFDDFVQQYRPLFAKLPPEFARYLEGALAYRFDDAEHARQQWEALLTELPAADRKYRTIWAAYMLGRMMLSTDFEAAMRWFEQARQAATEGFADSLQLAGESHGQEGGVYYRQQDYLKAMHAYVQYVRQTSSYYGLTSLLFACQSVLEQGRVDDALVRDPVSRSIFTAYIIAHPKNENFAEIWLDAVQTVKPEVTVHEAGRLAWIAYQLGRMDQAQQWVDLAHNEDVYGRWVHTKLLLRQGKVAEAIAILQELKERFPQEESWENTLGKPHRVYDIGDVCPQNYVQGELGVLLLARQQYVEALELFLRGNYWYDAAYIAENVLTVAELEHYVRHAYPEWLAQRFTRLADEQSNDLDDEWDEPAPHNLRYLLVRRLLREEQWDKAMENLDDVPAEIRASIVKYVEHIKAGRDVAVSEQQRAAHLYQAAQIARLVNIELLGTEGAPDWAVFSGSYELDGPEDYRLEQEQNRYPQVPKTYYPVILASDDEKWRADRHEVPINRRYHYRYYAAELFWEAAGLLPDNDLLTAQALYYGGKVTLERIDDEAYADRFYKALVNRCRQLPFGQLADRIRWFPNEPPEWQEDLLDLVPGRDDE